MQARLAHDRRRRGAKSVSSPSFVALVFSFSCHYSSSSDSTSFGPSSAAAAPRRRWPAGKAPRDAPLGAAGDQGPLQARALRLPFPDGGFRGRERTNFLSFLCRWCECKKPHRQLCRLLLGRDRGQTLPVLSRRPRRRAHHRGARARPAAQPHGRRLARDARDRGRRADVRLPDVGAEPGERRRGGRRGRRRRRRRRCVVFLVVCSGAPLRRLRRPARPLRHLDHRAHQVRGAGPRRAGLRGSGPGPRPHLAAGGLRLALCRWRHRRRRGGGGPLRLGGGPPAEDADGGPRDLRDARARLHGAPELRVPERRSRRRGVDFFLLVLCLLGSPPRHLRRADREARLHLLARRQRHRAPARARVQRARVLRHFAG